MRMIKKSVFRSISILSLAFIGTTSLISGASLAFAQTQLGVAPPQRVEAAPIAFTEPHNVVRDLARIDAALNNTISFSGRFSQYAADGSYAQGQIYLKRPGKLRFEYDDPNPLLIVSDGVTLTQRDRVLETTDRVPLSATPLNFFLKENVNLANDTEVIRLIKNFNEIRVTARDGSGDMDGTITMVFDPQSLNLKEWIIEDSFGGRTRVLLSDLRYNERINPRLFVLRNENRRERNR